MSDTANGNEKDNQHPEVSPRRVGLPVCPVVLVVGPMFAGKTTELLKRLREARDVGVNVKLVKASFDTRYSAG